MKEGYEEQMFRVSAGTTGKGVGLSFASNLLPGIYTLGVWLVIGMIVDLASGATKDLKKKSVYIEMIPQGAMPVSEKVIEKTVRVTKSLVDIPTTVAQQTTQTVVDTTIRGSAEQWGLIDQQKAAEMLEKKK
jgi:hypothetical protein